MIVIRSSLILLLFTEYRNLKTKLTNDNDRYQPAPVTASIATTTMINRTQTGAETMIDSTSSLAEGNRAPSI